MAAVFGVDGATYGRLAVAAAVSAKAEEAGTIIGHCPTGANWDGARKEANAEAAAACGLPDIAAIFVKWRLLRVRFANWNFTGGGTGGTRLP